MKMMRIFQLSCCFLLLVTSCEKEEPLTQPEKETGIAFCAGSYTNEKGFSVPCYWSGTTRKELGGEGVLAGMVSAMYVKDGVVYCAGTFSTLTRNGVHCYWIGDKLYELENVLYATPTCITYNNGEVYTGGQYVDSTLTEHSCYWKGAKIVRLPDNGYKTRINCIATEPSGTVYCAGNDNSISAGAPYYWENSTPHYLSNNEGDVKCIEIAGDIIYFGGYGNAFINPTFGYNTHRPCYWIKNDTQTHNISEDPGNCLAICNSNGSIYFGGNVDTFEGGQYDSNPECCYWKLNSPCNFLPESSYITALGSQENKIYCVVERKFNTGIPSFWDGSVWSDLVGATDIVNAQIRCYAVAR